MLNQQIKATLLFISLILAILAATEWYYDAKAYLGFIGAAFIALWAVNVVDLVDKWQSERRKFDHGVESRKPWFLKRQAD